MNIGDAALLLFVGVAVGYWLGWRACDSLVSTPIRDDVSAAGES